MGGGADEGDRLAVEEGEELFVGEGVDAGVTEAGGGEGTRGRGDRGDVQWRGKGGGADASFKGVGMQDPVRQGGLSSSGDRFGSWQGLVRRGRAGRRGRARQGRREWRLGGGDGD